MSKIAYYNRKLLKKFTKTNSIWRVKGFFGRQLQKIINFQNYPYLTFLQKGDIMQMDITLFNQKHEESLS